MTKRSDTRGAAERATTHTLTTTNILHLIKVKELLQDIKDSVCGAYDLDGCKSYITDKCDDFTDHIDALLGAGEKK